MQIEFDWTLDVDEKSERRLVQQIEWFVAEAQRRRIDKATIESAVRQAISSAMSLDIAGRDDDEPFGKIMLNFYMPCANAELERAFPQ